MIDRESILNFCFVFRLSDLKKIREEIEKR